MKTLSCFSAPARLLAALCALFLLAFAAASGYTIKFTATNTISGGIQIIPNGVGIGGGGSSMTAEEWVANYGVSIENVTDVTWHCVEDTGPQKS